MDIGTLTGQIQIEDKLSGTLNSISNSVANFAQDFDGVMGLVAGGAGIAAAAIAGVTASVIALGNRGAEVDDVSSTFERFTGSVEAADSALKIMREGTRNTLTDFDLMNKANKLLAAGVKLSAGEFGTLTQASFVLADQGLGSVESNLDAVSQAMLTGRTRALELKIGKIDLVSAEREFARTLGVTRDQLTTEGSLQAKRLAIIEALNDRVRKAGEIEKDFGDIMTGVVVTIKNWGDELSQQVANSPAVLGAVNAIGAAIAENFGGTGAAAIKAIVSGINSFAEGVTHYGPIIIRVLGGVKDTVLDVWSGLKTLDSQWQLSTSLIALAQQGWMLLVGTFKLVRSGVDGIVEGWGRLPQSVRDVTVSVTALVGVFVVANAAFTAAEVRFVALAARMMEYRAVAIAVEVAQKSLTVAYLLWTGALEAGVKWLGATTIGMRAVAIAQGLWTAAMTPLIAPLLALNLNLNVFIARMAASTVGLQVFNIAAIATTGLLGILGTALGAVLFVLVPLVAAWGAWKFGEWLAQFPAVQRAMIALAEKLHIISTESADARRALLDMGEALKTPMNQLGPSSGWFNLDPVIGALEKRLADLAIAAGKSGAELDAFVRQGVDRFRELKDNGGQAAQVLQAQLESLSKAGSPPRQALADLAVEAHRLKERGAPLTAELEQLTLLFPKTASAAGELGTGVAGAGRFIKGAGEDAEAFQKKVREMAESLLGKANDVDVFGAAFKRLSASQLESGEVLERLVPKIVQYAQAHQGQLTPAMSEALDKALELRTAYTTLGEQLLKDQGVTLEAVASQQRMGFSLDEIAARLGVTTKALSSYMEKLTDTRKITDDLVRSQDALAEQARQGAVKQVEVQGKREVQELGIDFSAGVISAQQFAQQRIQIEERTAAARLQLELKGLAQREAVEQRELDNQLARGELRGITDEQFNQKRLNIQTKYGLLRTDVVRAEETRITGLTTQGLSRTEALQRDYTRLVEAESMTRLDLQERDIDDWARAQIQAYDGAADGLQSYTDLVTRFSQRRKDALLLDDQAIAQNSQRNLQQIADKARNTYEFMKAHPEAFAEFTIDRFKKIAEAARREADGTQIAWDKAFDRLIGGLRIAGAVAEQLPGKFGDVASKVIGHLTNIAQALASGDWIGAIVAGITAIGEGIAALFRHPGRDAAVAFAEGFNTALPGTGFDELHMRLARLGPAGEQFWKQLTSERDVNKVQEIIKRINDAFSQLDSDMQRYNLTWKDMANAQAEASLAGLDLINTYDRLVDAGFDVELVTDRMSDELNQYIIDAVDAGVKIPAAMRPIIESLIEQGQLSAEAARAIMGMRDSSVPSLDDIRAAADRYGISLDSLGPKVKQLEITELADQYVADWKILTAATDDWGVIIDKMGPKVQSLVLDAIKYGSTLPEAMRPMIQAFVDAGALVDENGEKLTDLSKLTFAKDLTKAVDDLIKKLDELIETIAGPNGVAGAFDRAGRGARSALSDTETAADRARDAVDRTGRAFTDTQTRAETAGASARTAMDGVTTAADRATTSTGTLRDSFAPAAEAASTASAKIADKFSGVVVSAGQLQDETLLTQKIFESLGDRAGRVLADLRSRGIDPTKMTLEELMESIARSREVFALFGRSGSTAMDSVEAGIKDLIPPIRDVRNALLDLGRVDVPEIKIPYRYEARNTPPDLVKEAPEFEGPEEPRYQTFATGGIVKQYTGPAYEGARLIPFPATPKGMDSVPVLAQPGEGFVNMTGMGILGPQNLQSINLGKPMSVEGIDEILRSVSAAPAEQRALAEKQAAVVNQALLDQEGRLTTMITEAGKRPVEVNLGGVTLDLRGAKLPEDPRQYGKELGDAFVEEVTDKLLDVLEKGGERQTRAIRVVRGKVA
jgi:hypothetical protein